MSDDTISRQAAIDAIDVLKRNYPSSCFEDLCKAVDIAIKALSVQPERKKGKWIERSVSTEKVIDEWQSCKCSVCGRYDTRPYLYYFDEPRFCSWCGADMRA